MLTWQLLTATGETYTLQNMLQFEVFYGMGKPCDHFSLRALWQTIPLLPRACRVKAFRKGELLFYGILDEWEQRLDETGHYLECHGRGLQALLLDNEALSVDYGIATLQDILSRYVKPYGVYSQGGGDLPPVYGFSVRAGCSCWQVLHQFVCYHGGRTPYFSPQGLLQLDALPNPAPLDLSTLPQRACLWRGKRYGRLSQVQVQNRSTRALHTVRDSAFLQEGGSCSRVLTVPRNTSYQTMRYTAEFQLAQSRQEQDQVEVSFPLPFVALPTEQVSLALPKMRAQRTYRVRETTISLSQEGYCTKLLLY